MAAWRFTGTVPPLTIRPGVNLDAPINRPLCQDPRPMTGNRILDIAQRRGVFEVTWHYRNADLRKVCRKMCREGLLRQRRGPPGSDYFVLPTTRSGRLMT